MFSGQKASPEKSSVAQTFNRLSHFIKERRSIGDFASFHNMSSSMLVNRSEEMPRINTTMNLFPKKMGEDENLSTTGEDLKSLELFPLSSSSSIANSPDYSKIAAHDREVPTLQEESKASAAKMTIFYGGQVIVFDELAEDKAEEIMRLASQLGATSSNSETEAQNNFMAQPSLDTILEQPINLTIARRVSLHRFMEKRKHRIAAASPYQKHMKTKKSELMKHLLQKEHKQQLELKLF